MKAFNSEAWIAKALLATRLKQEKISANFQAEYRIT